MRRSYRGISINTSKNTHEKVFSMIDASKEATIIDIPTGSGAFVLRLKDNGFANVVAVDIVNILEIEHERFLVGDMTKGIPVENNSVDVLICIDGIEHISQQFDFVKEVNRILKIGGLFIVSTPNISSLRSRWTWMLTGHHHKCNAPLNENNPTPLHHIGMISFPEMRYLMHTNGFRIDKVDTNRIKGISWLYSLFVPLSYLVTSWVYRTFGKKEKTQKVNSEVKDVMFSVPVLFGETLIVRARKTASL